MSRYIKINGNVYWTCDFYYHQLNKINYYFLSAICFLNNVKTFFCLCITVQNPALSHLRDKERSHLVSKILFRNLWNSNFFIIPVFQSIRLANWSSLPCVTAVASLFCTKFSNYIFYFLSFFLLVFIGSELFTICLP